MKYLFKYAGKYFDIDNNEVVVSNNLSTKLDLYGFNIHELKNLKKEFIINKQLVTASHSSSMNMRLNIKNSSHRFVLIKLDEEYENLYFNVPRKMLVSEDGITWRCYQDINSYSEQKFNISLDNLNTRTLNEYDKKELLSMISYSTCNSRSLNLINTINAKYVFIEVYDLINRICNREECQERYNEDNLVVTANRDAINVKNIDTIKIDKLIIQILRPSDTILNTLKEF
jgi:hypothetical protein